MDEITELFNLIENTPTTSYQNILDKFNWSILGLMKLKLYWLSSVITQKIMTLILLKTLFEQN